MMKLRKTFTWVSLFMILISIILDPCCIKASAVSNENPAWSVEIESITLKDDLYTEETVINYDGSTEVLVHHNTPAEGNIYAIITISATKNNILAGALDTSGFKLQVSEGGVYSRLSEDSFLTYHNYAEFSEAGEINISSRGAMCFEIPESYLNTSTLGWVIYNGAIRSAPFQKERLEVPVSPNIVEEQSEIEDYLLAAYEKNGEASIHDPFVVLDPYGTAPLSALAIFETESPSAVSVTVRGKNGAKDFTYALSDISVHHEIPVIGLYADYNNHVVLSNGSEEKLIEIKTDPLPNDMPTVEIQLSQQQTVLENGFIFVAGYYRMLLDTSGEVRWYTSITVSHDPADVDSVSTEGGVWFSTDKYLSGIPHKDARVCLKTSDVPSGDGF